MFKPIVRVKITYKSGAVHELWLDEFFVTAVGGRISKCEWKAEWTTTRPVYIGLDNVESIWLTGRKLCFTPWYTFKKYLRNCFG